MARTTRRELNRLTQELVPNVIHSAYMDVPGQGKVDYFDEIVEFKGFDEIAYEGPTQFIVEGWTSPVLESPTQRDMINAISVGLFAVGDEHHIHFEGAQNVPVGGINFVGVFMGS